MGFFRSRFEQEGTGLPAPQTGWRRFFYLLATHFWKLIGLNLLTVLFSVPLITMPAAICAAYRVCILLIRNGNVFLWADFWQEFQRSFAKSFSGGCLAGIALFSGYFLMSLGAGNASLPGWSLLFWALGISFTFLSVTWGSYVLSLAAMTDLKLPAVMKNALLLIIINPGQALAVFLIILAMTLAAAALMPASILLLAVCWLSLMIFTVSWFVNALAEQYILQKTDSDNEKQL